MVANEGAEDVKVIHGSGGGNSGEDAGLAGQGDGLDVVGHRTLGRESEVAFQIHKIGVFRQLVHHPDGIPQGRFQLGGLGIVHLKAEGLFTLVDIHGKLGAELADVIVGLAVVKA